MWVMQTTVDHPLDLRCHPLQFVCSPFEVEGEGGLIGKVVIKMVCEVMVGMVGEVVVEIVGEVVVEMVREVVVHLSRHYHHYHPLLYLHPILPYPHTYPSSDTSICPHTYPSPDTFIPP